MVGIPPSHWRSFYLDALLSYANYVQLLPASETHHHAGAGGLLSHGLEVALHALRLRRAYLLPQGADTEEIAAKREAWIYAVLSAALLHDINKKMDIYGRPINVNVITNFIYWFHYFYCPGRQRFGILYSWRGTPFDIRFSLFNSNQSVIFVKAKKLHFKLHFFVRLDDIL